MSVDRYDDEAPLSHQAEVYCDECNAVFTAIGTHTPATLEEPAEFDTEDTLCEECKEKQDEGQPTSDQQEHPATE